MNSSDLDDFGRWAAQNPAPKAGDAADTQTVTVSREDYETLIEAARIVLEMRLSELPNERYTMDMALEFGSRCWVLVGRSDNL